MINANDARIRTYAQLEVMAKEFIVNTVQREIEKSVNQGCFSASIDVIDLENVDVIGPKIVEVLERDYGFVATYNAHLDQYRPEYFINVHWDGTEQ